jgi:hypothetical protein
MVEFDELNCLGMALKLTYLHTFIFRGFWCLTFLLFWLDSPDVALVITISANESVERGCRDLCNTVNVVFVHE